MKQATIIGLGMIGTSLGLALRRLPSPPRVIGTDSQFDAAQRAGRLKAVDRAERRLEDAVSGSDLVIIATPVGAVREVLRTIAPVLSQGSVVTDTGSTKRQVVYSAGELLPSTIAFVGGHPMAGRLTSGVAEPDANLFAGTVYCLTPSSSTPPDAVSAVANMVRQIGAQPYFLDPEEHDGLVAGISHLPYVVSATLMRVLAGQQGWREMSDLAAGGFDSMTRLAAHDPDMFADIVKSNSDNVSRQLSLLIDALTSTRDRLAAGETDLVGELRAANSLRVEWERQREKSK